MNQFERQAIVAALIKNMRDNKSWTGETHIQKCVYFLQTMLSVDLDFNFLLYRYGPYSFDLTEELEAMQFYSAIEFETPIPPYGPRFTTGEGYVALEKKYPQLLRDYANQIGFVGSNISIKTVQDLERLGTVWYFMCKNGGTLIKEAVIKSVLNVKPHISQVQAERAYEECQLLLEKSRKLGE